MIAYAVGCGMGGRFFEAHAPISRPRMSTHAPMLMLMKMPKRRLPISPRALATAPVAPLDRLLSAFCTPALSWSVWSFERVVVELSDFWRELTAASMFFWMVGTCSTRPWMITSPMKMARTMVSAMTISAPSDRRKW